MPFKVLDQDWNKIIVDEINPDIHMHLSWRRFEESEACVQKKVEEYIEEYDKTLQEKAEDLLEEVTEINMEEAREQYKEKYWRYPSSKTKLETIISKL